VFGATNRGVKCRRAKFGSRWPPRVHARGGGSSVPKTPRISTPRLEGGGSGEGKKDVEVIRVQIKKETDGEGGRLETQGFNA